VSREITTFVELTSTIGRLGNCPTGMTVIPEVEVANKFCPSVEATIFELMFSGNRKPICGVRLEDRSTCSMLVAAAGDGVGVIVGVVPVVCGLFGFSGLIAGCVKKVA